MIWQRGTGTYTSYNDGATVDSFNYHAKDVQGESNLATVTITITPPEAAQETPSNTSPQSANEGGTQQASDGQGGQAPSNTTVTPDLTPTPANPPASDLPTGIIFDASTFRVTRSLRMKIETNTGIVLYDNFEATYINNSVDSALNHTQVGENAEILSVFAVDPKAVNLILDEQTSSRFLQLLSQKDYGAENKIVVVRKDP